MTSNHSFFFRNYKPSDWRTIMYLTNYEPSEIRTFWKAWQMFGRINPNSFSKLWLHKLGIFVFFMYTTLELWTFVKTKVRKMNVPKYHHVYVKQIPFIPNQDPIVLKFHINLNLKNGLLPKTKKYFVLRFIIFHEKKNDY